MAGWFDSPSLFSGQPWSAWKQHLDKLSGLLVNQESSSGNEAIFGSSAGFSSFQSIAAAASEKQLQDKHEQELKKPNLISSPLLKAEDMILFGRYQTTEDSYFVVCELCGDILRPHALKRHLSLPLDAHRDKPSSSSSSSNIEHVFSKPAELPTLKSEPMEVAEVESDEFDEDEVDLVDADESMRRVMSLILSNGATNGVAAPKVQPVEQKPIVLSDKTEEILSTNGNAFAVFDFEPEEPQSILPRNDAVPFWHTLGAPAKFVPPRYASSSPEFIVGKSLMVNHKFDFVRSALSRLVCNLDSCASPGSSPEKLLEKQSSNAKKQPLGNGRMVRAAIERLLSLVSAASDAKRRALLAKLSPPLVEGLSRGAVSLQQLTARDRYIIGRIYDSVNGKQHPTNSSNGVAKIEPQQPKTVVEKPSPPVVAVPKQRQKRKSESMKQASVVQLNAPSQYDQFEFAVPYAVSATPPPPPPPNLPPPSRPNILSRSSSSKSILPKSPPLHTQTQPQQQQVVMLSPTPPKQAKSAETTSPVAISSVQQKAPPVRLVAGASPRILPSANGAVKTSPNNSVNNNNHHQIQVQQQRQILPARGMVTAGQSQQIIHFAATSGTQVKGTVMPTAFIAITNGGTGANGDHHHHPLTMLTIPVSTTLVQQLQLQQQQQQQQQQSSSGLVASQQARLLPKQQQQQSTANRRL